MCQVCIDAVHEIFPEADDEEMSFLLWEKTAFPLSQPDETRQQLIKYKEALAQGKDVCNRCGAIATMCGFDLCFGCQMAVYSYNE